ncbi:replication factor C large subunit [Candidatus Woesearchaeota archaeon]|nr:replication factor C large subunit [Candidatus Woesearchaeota archaeon]
MHPYAKKFLPEKSSDIIGQDMAVNELKDYISNYKSQKKKAALLFGPTGTGKTSSVHSIANEMGLEILEVNASDTRNAEEINQRIGAAMGQQSLFSKGKIILLDEIDGLSGTGDRGGIQALISLLEKSAFPVVLTATNPWDNKFSKLRSKSEMIAFNPLEADDVFSILKKICAAEKIKHDDSVLKGLARRSGGDARASINDLQMLTMLSGELTKESLEELSERNREETILSALTRILKTTDPKVALAAFDNVRENLDEQLLWLDENIPREYTNPEDLARAYEKLSRADVFNRRIRRWQHWRFLVYINELITAGIALSKDEKYRGFTEYKPTGRILKLWWAKQKSMKKKAIAEKIAERTHTSVKDALKSSLPYMQHTFRKSKQFREELTKELELSREEAEWMGK